MAMLMEDTEVCTLGFLRVAKIGNLDCCKTFIEEMGVDVNARNSAALRFAAKKGHLQIVKYLLDRGADVHALDDFALRVASANGELKMVKLLLENGANVHAQDNSALRWATFDFNTSSQDILQRLFQSENKENVAPYTDEKVLRFSVAFRQLKHTLHLNTENGYRHSIRRVTNHKHVVICLLEHRAKFNTNWDNVDTTMRSLCDGFQETRK